MTTTKSEAGVGLHDHDSGSVVPRDMDHESALDDARFEGGRRLQQLELPAPSVNSIDERSRIPVLVYAGRETTKVACIEENAIASTSMQ